VGIPVIALIIGYSVFEARRLSQLEAGLAEADAAEASLPPAFPTPPLDLVVPPSPRLVNAGVTVPAVTEGQPHD
jgi:NADH-quinone oxidoreductase subunit H